MSVKIFIITFLCIYRVYCQIGTYEQLNSGESEKKTVKDDSYSQENEKYTLDNVNLKENSMSTNNENNALNENSNAKEDSGSTENVNFVGKKNKDLEENAEENTEESTEENYDNTFHNKESYEKHLNQLQPREDHTVQEFSDDEDEDKNFDQLQPREDDSVQEFNDDEDEDIEEFKRHESDENEENLLKEELEKELQKQRLAGSVADYFGTNQHYEIPANFYEFGRRFVLSYPYFEKNNTVDPAVMKLDRDVKEQLEVKKHYFNHLTPLKAPPEFVLSVAKQSAILEGTKPKNPSEDIITKNILRTGNFWNGVWKEDVDKKTLLRTSSKSSNKLEKVTVEIEPGSKLYELVSALKKRSPVLLYVINKYNAD